MRTIMASVTMMTVSVKPSFANTRSRLNAGVRRSPVRAGAAPMSGDKSVSRRDAFKIGTSALQLLMASKAWALIPGNDDEDEELLAKAKAGRTQRIQAERALEKNYVTKNDLKLDADTSKVQVAVFKLSKAGGLIESGYLALAAEALGQGSWEAELRDAGSNLGKNPKAFLDAVSALKTACAGGDAAEAKKTFITAARSLETFANDTKTADNLKFL